MYNVLMDACGCALHLPKTPALTPWSLSATKEAGQGESAPGEHQAGRIRDLQIREGLLERGGVSMSLECSAQQMPSLKQQETA